MRGRPPSQRPVPECFHIYGAKEGDLLLKRRYSAGRSLIVRWRQLSGVYCGKPRGPKQAHRPPPRPKKRYTSTAMTETISWYDGEDDLDVLFASHGLHRLVIGD